MNILKNKKCNIKINDDYSIEEDLEETMKCLKEANKEIERLNKELDKTRLSELNKEYIINELEKWLYDKQVDRGDICDFLNFDKEIKVHEVRNKLQELKGSDK